MASPAHSAARSSGDNRISASWPRKWSCSDGAVALTADRLEELDPQYPPGEPGIEKLKLV